MSAVDATPTIRLRPSQITTSVSDSEEFAWRVLILLNVFRLTLGSLLLAVFLAATDPRIIGGTNPTLAWGALVTMLAFGVVEIALLRLRIPSSGVQIYAQLAVDLTVTTALMHASGGVPSGVGGLLVISVGALALLVTGRHAFFFAAVAALTILGEQTLSQLQGVTDTAAYAPAGILGAVIFFIAIVVQLLRYRMLETEALAEQRGVDLKSLGDLNQYIVQHLRESIVVVDGDDRLRLINESAATQLGAASGIATQPLSEVSPELADRLATWRRGGRAPGEPPLDIGSADGATTIIPHFAPMGSERSGGTLIFLEDTSLLAERVQQTKLASLGRLSASIAHEIRNPVGAMSHAGQLLAESPDLGPEEERLTDIIRVNGTRVSQIVESVLALSRRDKTKPERLQLRPWIEEFVEEFIQTLELTEDVVAVLDSAADTEVRMDLTHLHQIVWNLCDNAVKYASAAADECVVELNYGRLEVSGRPYLEITDRGPGIDPRRIEEVFEPFYTGVDGGTGLGLFISRELCEYNGATLRYKPRDGGGSVFRVVFADPTRWQ
jgi:two-component system sensor histidine kinase PilS (NtrC family)